MLEEDIIKLEDYNSKGKINQRRGRATLKS